MIKKIRTIYVSNTVLDPEDNYKRDTLEDFLGSPGDYKYVVVVDKKLGFYEAVLGSTTEFSSRELDIIDAFGGEVKEVNSEKDPL